MISELRASIEQRASLVTKLQMTAAPADDGFVANELDHSATGEATGLSNSLSRFINNY